MVLERDTYVDRVDIDDLLSSRSCGEFTSLIRKQYGD